MAAQGRFAASAGSKAHDNGMRLHRRAAGEAFDRVDIHVAVVAALGPHRMVTHASKHAATRDPDIWRQVAQEVSPHAHTHTPTHRSHNICGEREERTHPMQRDDGPTNRASHTPADTLPAQRGASYDPLGPKMTGHTPCVVAHAAPGGRSSTAAATHVSVPVTWAAMPSRHAR